jgi:hypothetical protein
VLGQRLNQANMTPELRVWHTVSETLCWRGLAVYETDTMLDRWQLDVKAARERVYRAPKPREREHWPNIVHSWPGQVDRTRFSNISTPNHPRP